MNDSNIDERFLDVGFEKVGHWFLDSNQLDYDLTKLENESHLVYSFLSENQILYIGKTSRKLKERMAGYKNPGQSQSTNIANKSNIIEILTAGKSLEIFAYSHDEDILFRGIKIDVADGIEGPLIALFKPKWNRLGNSLTRSDNTEEEKIVDPSILYGLSASAKYKTYEISKNEAKQITVTNSGKLERNTIKSLRIIASEIGISDKNANGNNKNTQNLGAQIIKQISQPNP